MFDAVKPQLDVKMLHCGPDTALLVARGNDDR
jgi:hypothetical protein